jgi:hypothetical protein
MEIPPQFSQCSIDNNSYRINTTIISGHIYLLNKTPITFHISMYSLVLLFYVILCNFLKYILEGCVGRSQHRARINPKPVHLGFVVDQVTV